MLACRGAIDLGKALEQLGLVNVADPRSRILDRHMQPRSRRLMAQSQAHGALAGEFERVADQVEQDLPHPVRVQRHEFGKLAPGDEIQRQALSLRLRREHQKGVVREVDRSHRSRRELELAGLQLGEIQDVVDDRQQRLAGRQDAVQVASTNLVQTRAFRQQVGEAQDRGQRRADFVAHIGQELALRGRGGLGLLAGLSQIRFQQLAWGDVADDIVQAVEAASDAVPGEGGLAFQPERAAVLVRRAKLHGPGRDGAFGVEHRLAHGQHLGPVVRVHQRERSPPHQFLRREAGDREARR